MSDGSVVVILETDEYRGDHAKDVTVGMTFSLHSTLAEVIAEANRMQTYEGTRATIIIPPPNRGRD